MFTLDGMSKGQAWAVAVAWGLAGCGGVAPGDPSPGEAPTEIDAGGTAREIQRKALAELASGGATAGSGGAGAVGATRVAAGGGEATGGAQAGGATGTAGDSGSGGAGAAQAAGGTAGQLEDSGLPPADCLLYRHPCESGYTYDEVNDLGPNTPQNAAYYRAYYAQHCPEDRTKCLIRRDVHCPGNYILVQWPDTTEVLQNAAPGCNNQTFGCASGANVSSFSAADQSNPPAISVTYGSNACIDYTSPSGVITEGGLDSSGSCTPCGPSAYYNAEHYSNEFYRPWSIPGLIPP